MTRAPAVEQPAAPPPSASELLSDIAPTLAVNGLIGFMFAATGPVAVILSIGTAGGLDRTQLASWIFGAFFINGLVTIALSWRYRLPLVCFWTIPGAVLVGQALDHASHAEVLGAYLLTGALMTALGLSGWMSRLQSLMPMTIVMGMVAGVFLRFGLDLVRAVHQDVAIAAPMVLAFVALSALPRLSGRIPTLLSVLMPPMIGALLVGALAIAWGGRMDWSGGSNLSLIAPALYRPAFSPPVLLELVVPLAITVLVVQNGQGYAVLKSVGHAAPVNAVTLACGSASMLTTFVGSVSTCLTGPTNAIVSSSGEPHRHYTGAIVVGLLAVAFGLFASAFTTVMLATPKAFIATLGGLAMLRALQGSFTTAFSGSYPLGALVAFLVTVTDLPILNVGAAFWGLVFGMATSFLLERRD